MNNPAAGSDARAARTALFWLNVHEWGFRIGIGLFIVLAAAKLAHWMRLI